MKRHYLQFSGPKDIEIKEEVLPSLPPDHVLVKAQFSAISPGTELLLYQGFGPSALETDDSLAALTGKLTYPFRFGYSLVGEVIETGREVKQALVGRKVFAFHPHADFIHALPHDLLLLDSSLDPLDSVFLPNVETALNLVHDGSPLLGEIVVIFGQGVVGLLTTSLLSRIQLSRLITIEPVAARRNWSKELGATTIVNPEDPDQVQELNTELGLPSQHAGADLCFELSGQPSALNQAIELTRFSGRIVLGSWYGTRKSEVNLGSRFHRNRIQIYSSQVSTVNPTISGRWDKKRRYYIVQQLLPDIQPSRLITHTFPFHQAALAYTKLDQSPQDAVAVVLDYEQ